MTSSRMENPLWKKLQNDPSLMKFQQQLSNGSTEANNNLLGVNELNRNMITASHINEFSSDPAGMELNSLQSLILNNSTPSMTQLSPDSLNMLKQHQLQLASSSYATLVEHQNQQLQNLQQFINMQKSNGIINGSSSSINNSNISDVQYYANETNSEQSLNHMLMPNPIMNDIAPMNVGYKPAYNGNFSAYELRQQKQHRERGIVEKIVGSYGFVKCLDREGRLFFHYSSFQTGSNGVESSLKVGDFVEFEEGTDKRNGKPIAINLMRFDKTSGPGSSKSASSQQQDMSIDSSLNLMNLKELLLKNNTQSLGEGNLMSQQQQQQHNYIMNSLKMLNMQNVATNNSPTNSSNETAATNLNSIMNFFNKENIFNNTTNTSNSTNLNQTNINTNILNMAKTAVASAGVNGNDNLAVLAKMFNVNTTTTINNNINNNVNAEVKPKNSDEQMEGSVAIVATKRPNSSSSHYNGNMLPQQLDGRITYQRSGETFYIPYSFSDVVSTTNAQLRIGDRVKFYIAHLLNNQMPVVSTYYARKVELISSQDSFMSISELAQHLIAQQQQQQPKQVYRGIITTLKDSFGKIEREDLFKETFFHFSEYRGQNANQELRLGLNVEFELQDRHGKEIACNIRMLKDGTVSFDELSGTVYIGRITEPLTKINSGINLNGLSMAGLSSVGTIHSIGRLIYDTNISCNSVNNGESLINLSFTDRDRVSGSGDYTLLEGDFVQFRIASDKRRKTAPMNSNINVYQRATQLTLIEEHSLVENSINTHEHRERGVLVKLYTAKDLLPASSHHHSQLDAKFGAIQCLEQNELVYFSFNEVINYVRFTNNNLGTTYSINEIQLQVGDSLEFSVVKCQKDLVFKNGLKAIRLRQLAKNSVQFEIISTETYSGLVEREAFHSSSSSPFNDNSTGLIRFDFKNGQTSGKNSSSQTIGYSYSEDQVFNTGDKVKFNMSTCLKTKKQTAVNVKLFEAFKEQGIITLVKDQLGFIEIIGAQQKNSKQQKILREIVFNSGSLTTISLSDLNVGDHVEFIVNKKNRPNFRAENLTKITSKKSAVKLYSNLSSTVHKGRVTQQLKSHNTANSNLVKNNFEELTQQQIDDEYFGKLQITTTSNERKDSVGSANDLSVIQFGISGLIDRKLCLQVGDMVSFQIGTCYDGTKKAFNLQPITESQQHQQQQQSQSRQRNNNEVRKGKIESIKGHCGYIEYSPNNNEDRKKVFFHMSDLIEENVNGNGSESSSLKVGDEIEFILMHNSRSGKYSAVKIKKSNVFNQKANSEAALNGSQLTVVNDQDPANKRPERLITKLKLANIDDKSGKQLILARQPNNPDGKAKSFGKQLVERLPGSLEPLLIKTAKTNDQASNESESNDSNDEPEQQQQQQQQQPQTAVSSLSIIDLLMASNLSN